MPNNHNKHWTVISHDNSKHVMHPQGFVVKLLKKLAAFLRRIKF